MLQYNFFRELGNRWSFSFDFLLNFKSICIQPIHICLDADNFYLSIGLVFIRIKFSFEKWDSK